MKGHFSLASPSERRSDYPEINRELTVSKLSGECRSVLEHGKPRERPAFQEGQGDALLMSYLYYTGDATDLLENILHSKDQHGLGLQNLYGYRNPRVDALI